MLEQSAIGACDPPFGAATEGCLAPTAIDAREINLKATIVSSSYAGMRAKPGG